MDDFVDSPWGDAEIFANLVLADAQRLQKLLMQNLTRMYRRDLAHNSPLVIVDNLYVIGVSVSPDEADSPLVVYPNAVLPLTVAGQGFKSIPWRNKEIVNR